MGNKEEILGVYREMENQEGLYDNKLERPEILEEESKNVEETNEKKAIETEIGEFIEGLIDDGVSYKEIGKKVLTFIKHRLNIK